MDFNFSNIFEHLDNDQKRIATAFVLSIPIAYILCLRVGGESFYNLDVLTRLFYAVTLSVAFMVANYIAIIIGQSVTGLFMPYRYMQLFAPQIFAVSTSIAYNQVSVRLLSFVYILTLNMIIFVHIFVRLVYPRHDAEPQQKQRHRTKKRKHRKVK